MASDINLLCVDYMGYICKRVWDLICNYELILKYRDGEWEQIDHWVTPAEGVKLISMTEIEVEECGCGL